MGVLYVVLFLMLFSAAHQGETMLVRRYGKKYGSGGMLFNGVICLFAMIFFILSDKDGLHFVPGIWGYGIANAVIYGAGFYFGYLAYKTGKYFITTTITSMQFVIPIIYGLVILREPANYLTYCALICSVVSVCLMCYGNRGKSASGDEDKGFSVKWLVFVLITLFSNGLISVLAKIQQTRFGGQHTNEYMVITLFGAFLTLGIMGLVLEGNTLRKTVLKGGLYGMAAGLLNGFKNAINLMLIMSVPLSVLTPLKKGV